MSQSKCFDKICEKYYSKYGSNPEYEYFLEEMMRVVKKGKLLDIGCGVGLPVVKYLVTKGFDVTAIDFSKKMIEAAKENVPQAEFLYDDITKIKLEEQSFDGVISFFTFNFMRKKDLEKCFSKISASVKEEGGILIGAIEGDFEGEVDLLGEKIYVHKLSENYLRTLLKDFHIFLIERKEFHPEGEDVQNQIFIIGKKKTYVELMLDEEKPSDLDFSPPKEKELSEVKAHQDEQTTLDLSGSIIVPSLQEEKKQDKEVEDSDDEEPAIRITFFRKSKKKKDV